jgi:hypothetical protein
LGYFFAAARLAAHIFLVAAIIAALPAALSFRFGFGAAFEVGVAVGVGVADDWGSGLPFIAAHLLRWASAMAFASRCADLPPCRFFRCRYQSGLGRFPRKECAEFSYLSIDTAFLLFEAKNCGSYHFFGEFGVGMSLGYVFSHSDMILFCVS